MLTALSVAALVLVLVLLAALPFMAGWAAWPKISTQGKRRGKRRLRR